MPRRWGRRLARALDDRVELLRHAGDTRRGDITAVGASLAVVEADLQAAATQAHLAREAAAGSRARTWALMRAIAAEEPRARRAVQTARSSPGYADAWDDPEPLVSVVIPTRTRVGTLLGRSLPSVLTQTHRNLEVIVVGDRAAAEVEDAVGSVGDPRVRWLGTTYRVPFDDDRRAWLAGSVLARNTGRAAAHGLWVSDFDDDDALRPDAVERALATARSGRCEVVYGRQFVHHADGSTSEVGEFPPQLGRFSFQGSLVHAGLGWFGRDLAAAPLGVPNDWECMERMLRAGVRVGMVADVVAELWPSPEWGLQSRLPEPGEG